MSDESAAIADAVVTRFCPVCGNELPYYELECNEPYTAPAPLAWKALLVWGAYDAYKETIHQHGNFIHFRLGNTERLVEMKRFDQEGFFKRQEQVRNANAPCEQEGCHEMGDACFTLFEPDEPMGFYCAEHKHEHGICPGCNMFYAGFESFDFSETGYCAGCSEQFENAFYTEDYEEYGTEDWDDGD